MNDKDNKADFGQQFQEMQQAMVRTQKELAEETLEITAGGGAITIVISGHQRIKSIVILPDIIDRDDPQTLQDALMAAVNNAIERSQLMAAQRLESLTEGLGIPGLDS